MSVKRNLSENAQVKYEEKGAVMHYCFKVENVRVNVLFSDKATAPTIENALVKIAMRKDR